MDKQVSLDEQEERISAMHADHARAIESLRNEARAGLVGAAIDNDAATHPPAETVKTADEVAEGPKLLLRGVWLDALDLLPWLQYTGKAVRTQDPPPLAKAAICLLGLAVFLGLLLVQPPTLLLRAGVHTHAGVHV